MLSREVLDIVAVCNLPASEAAIATAESACGVPFPNIFSQILRLSDGMHQRDDSSVILYACREIPERNRTFEVARFAPHLLMIGDDGGGRGFFIQAANDPECRVFTFGTGAIGLSKPKPLGHLEEWITKGMLTD
jgi:hypothetical protein